MARTPACLTALSTISVTSCIAWQQAHSSYKVHNPVLFQTVTVIGQRYLGFNPRCFNRAHSSPVWHDVISNVQSIGGGRSHLANGQQDYHGKGKLAHLGFAEGHAAKANVDRGLPRSEKLLQVFRGLVLHAL
jgi:hypothetical protein